MPDNSKRYKPIYGTEKNALGHPIPVAFEEVKDTYKTEWTCDNCFHQFLKWVEKGRRRPPTTECPNCGCQTDGKIFR